MCKGGREIVAVECVVVTVVEWNEDTCGKEEGGEVVGTVVSTEDAVRVVKTWVVKVLVLLQLQEVFGKMVTPAMVVLEAGVMVM